MMMNYIYLVVFFICIQVNVFGQDSLYNKLNNEIVKSYEILAKQEEFIYFEYYRHKYLEDTVQRKLFLDGQFSLEKILSRQFGENFVFNDLRNYQTVIVEGSYEDRGVIIHLIYCIIQTENELLIYKNSSVNNYHWENIASKDINNPTTFNELQKLVTDISLREKVDYIGTMEFLVSFINKGAVFSYPVWLTDKDLLLLYTIFNIKYK